MMDQVKQVRAEMEKDEKVSTWIYECLRTFDQSCVESPYYFHD